MAVLTFNTFHALLTHQSCESFSCRKQLSEGFTTELRQVIELLHTILADFQDQHLPLLIDTSTLSTASLTLAFAMLLFYIICL